MKLNARNSKTGHCSTINHNKTIQEIDGCVKVLSRPILFSPEDMEIIDYNGTDRWSLQAIQERYITYARRLKVSPVFVLKPVEVKERNRHWIYPVMFQVIEGIEKGDRACVTIGVELIEEDQRFSFGRVIKSNTARALRRTVLTPEQISRIRKRVVHMLIAEKVPREYREYAKLLRKVGMGDWWPCIEEQANRNNPYVMRYYNYFQEYVRPKEYYG